MRQVDMSDVLIVVGATTIVVGLYFLAWPLVLVFVGALLGTVGLRRMS